MHFCRVRVPYTYILSYLRLEILFLNLQWFLMNLKVYINLKSIALIAVFSADIFLNFVF